LLNDFSIPILQQKVFKTEKIVKELKKISKNIIAIPAVDICEKELGKSVVAGIYLLTYASCKNLIPLKPDTILKAIKKAVNPKYFELNKKTFNLAKNNVKN
jgi:Pyruvate/2-oxoacid:ferredoxin oxidoreductase gamma subunit